LISIRQILQDDGKRNIFFINNLATIICDKIEKEINSQLLSGHDFNHATELFHEIVQYYVNIKIRSFAKSLTADKGKFFIRQKLSRLLNFMHV
jgi:hypothetical protein